MKIQKNMQNTSGGIDVVLSTDNRVLTVPEACVDLCKTEIYLRWSMHLSSKHPAFILNPSVNAIIVDNIQIRFMTNRASSQSCTQLMTPIRTDVTVLGSYGCVDSTL